MEMQRKKCCFILCVNLKVPITPNSFLAKINLDIHCTHKKNLPNFSLCDFLRAFKINRK